MGALVDDRSHAQSTSCRRGFNLEVVEEDGGLEEGAGAEPGGDGETGLPRDRQPRGGHGLVPRAGARACERRHAPIRQDRLLRRAPGARVWRIGHWRGGAERSE
jgi:hypothetical protein